MVYSIEGNVVDRTSSKNGKGWCENVSPTLNTQDRHAIVYAIDQQGGKGNCGYAENIMMTLCSDSHGTPHAVAYGVVSKGNGEAFITEERHMSLSIGGGQAGQGYPAVLYGNDESIHD